MSANERVELEAALSRVNLQNQDTLKLGRAEVKTRIDLEVIRKETALREERVTDFVKGLRVRFEKEQLETDQKTRKEIEMIR